MKSIYTLYSVEHPKGLKLSEVYDSSQAYVLKQYYKQTYTDDRFKVTVKLPRKKEEWVTGGYK